MSCYSCPVKQSQKQNLPIDVVKADVGVVLVVTLGALRRLQVLLEDVDRRDRSSRVQLSPNSPVTGCRFDTFQSEASLSAAPGKKIENSNIRRCLGQLGYRVSPIIICF